MARFGGDSLTGGGQMNRVAILGAGGMGTALALLFGRVADDVRLWSRDHGHAAELVRTRINDRHLPGIVLPEAIRITSSATVAGDDADLIVAAIPTSYLRATLESLAPELPPGDARSERGQGNRVRVVCTPEPDHRDSRSARGRSPCSAARAMPKSWREGCRLRWSFPGSRNR